MFKHIVMFFFFFLNRIVPITISTYRYILVCQNQKAERFGKVKLGRILIFATSLVTILGTVFSVVYRDDYLSYTHCIGREETFTDYLREEEVDPSLRNTGRYISLPLYHPARLLYFLVAMTYFLMTPMVYGAIYRFRRNHDRTVTGKYKIHPHQQYKYYFLQE